MWKVPDMREERWDENAKMKGHPPSPTAGVCHEPWLQYYFHSPSANKERICGGLGMLNMDLTSAERQRTQPCRTLLYIYIYMMWNWIFMEGAHQWPTINKDREQKQIAENPKFMCSRKPCARSSKEGKPPTLHPHPEIVSGKADLIVLLRLSAHRRAVLDRLRTKHTKWIQWTCAQHLHTHTQTCRLFPVKRVRH